MPSSKKPRRKYVPKYTGTRAAVQRAMAADIGVTLRSANTASYTDEELTHIRLTSRTALQAVQDGKATSDDVHQLAFMSNLTLLLCEKGMGAEFTEEVQAIQRDHLMSLVGRMDRGESLLLTGPGLVAVRRLLDIHEAQVECEEFTGGLAFSAVRDVLSRMYEGNVFTIT